MPRTYLSALNVITQGVPTLAELVELYPNSRDRDRVICKVSCDLRNLSKEWAGVRDLTWDGDDLASNLLKLRFWDQVAS